MSPSNTPPPEVQVYPSEESVRRGHEVQDVNPRSLLWLGAAVVVGVVIVQILLWFMLAGMRSSEDGDQRLSPLAKQAPPPPAPRLQSQSLRDYEEYRREQEAKLNSYGWFDREKGIVRVPITRAMELVAERGLPAAVSAPATNDSNQPQGASPGSSPLPTGASAPRLIPAAGKPAEKKGEP
jgi:hypothetical protein